MSGASKGTTCERIIERLVDGVRAGDDPEVGAHLSTCLRCYRVAADLRDLPQLTELLREGHPELQRHGSPGEDFWRSFPDAVASSWARAQGQSGPAPEAARTTPTTTATTTVIGWPLFTRLRGWLRRPMPAAFAGAACAAAVAFVVIRPLRPVPVSVPAASMRGAPPAATMEDSAGVSLEDVPLPRSQGLDDSVRDLDAGALRRVLEGLDRELGLSAAASNGPSRGGGGADDDDLDGAAASGRPEELDELELEGLEALREGLGRSI